MSDEYSNWVAVKCPACQKEINKEVGRYVAAVRCPYCDEQFWPDAVLMDGYYACDRLAFYCLEDLFTVGLVRLAMESGLDQLRAEKVVIQVFSEIRRTKYDPEDPESAETDEAQLTRYDKNRSSVANWIELRTSSRAKTELARPNPVRIGDSASDDMDEEVTTPSEEPVDRDLINRVRARSPGPPASREVTQGPRIKAGQSFVVTESADHVGTASLIRRAESSFIWEIVGGNELGIFAVDPRTGQITIRDHEKLRQNSSFMPSLTVSDGEMTSEPQHVTVQVIGDSAQQGNALDDEFQSRIDTATNASHSIAAKREHFRQYLEAKEDCMNSRLDERERLVFNVWYRQAGAQGWNKIAAAALKESFPEQGKSPTAAANCMDEVIKKLNECFQEKGLAVELPRKTTGG